MNNTNEAVLREALEKIVENDGFWINDVDLRKLANDALAATATVAKDCGERGSWTREELLHEIGYLTSVIEMCNKTAQKWKDRATTPKPEASAEQPVGKRLPCPKCAGTVTKVDDPCAYCGGIGYCGPVSAAPISEDTGKAPATGSIGEDAEFQSLLSALRKPHDGGTWAVERAIIAHIDTRAAASRNAGVVEQVFNDAITSGTGMGISKTWVGEDGAINVERIDPASVYATTAPDTSARDAAIRSAGATMANVMFNMAQKTGHTLTSDDTALFDKLRLNWDAIRALKSSPAPADSSSAAPSDAPVAGKLYRCTLAHCVTGEKVEWTLLRVDEDDCDWRTADDHSELAYEWEVTAWREDAPALAAPSPTGESLSAAEIDDMCFGYAPSGKIGELRELLNAYHQRIAPTVPGEPT